ncbi:MAG: Fic family protein [Nanoarchaeota archaeon]|nr:Fic family protein [Nanoarchaeota archaeon]
MAGGFRHAKKSCHSPAGKGARGDLSYFAGIPLFEPIDISSYFKKETDERMAQTRFDFGVFDLLKNILSEAESRQLSALDMEYRAHRKRMAPSVLQREFERLTIELSWKSSRIEGNTYTLLETEALIQNHEAAPGHKKEEATMILNHKKALDFIRSHPSEFKKLSSRNIREAHELLTRDLKIKRGFRQSPVGITGTRYRPPDNEHQISEAVKIMCDTVNAEPDFFAKAILASLLTAYIQPFEDGNKRTSRMIGNTILMAYRSCPLSYRSVNETEYKKAVILFYEQNNLTYFKELFIGQFEFAVRNYFVSSVRLDSRKEISSGQWLSD